MSETREVSENDFILQSTREFARMCELVRAGKIPDLLRVQEAQQGVEDLTKVLRSMNQTIQAQKAQVENLKKEIAELRGEPVATKTETETTIEKVS